MNEKYDQVAKGYNNSRSADEYLYRRLKHLLNPSLTGRYLDIGCGTGNYTNKFAEEGYQFIGIDPSLKMLEVAASGSDEVVWLKGKAEDLSVLVSHLDGAIAHLTIHHWSSIEKGFNQVSNVLKPRARFVIFTALPEQVEGYWLNHYFPKMMKIGIDQLPSLDAISNSLYQSGMKVFGMERYFISPFLTDLIFYSGKRKPEMYLDDQFRSSVSPFSFLAIQEEVDAGLKELKADISSGIIKEIIENYENDLGDHLFIIAEKN